MAADRESLTPPDPPTELSLEELAAAFARAMDRSDASASACAGTMHAADSRDLSAAEVEAESADDAAGGQLVAESRAAESKSDGCSGSFRPTTETLEASHAEHTFLDQTQQSRPGGAPRDRSAASADDAEVTDDQCPITPAAVLEAMLFVGDPDGNPIAPSRAAELMRGVSPGEIAALVDELNARYRADRRPYHIVSQGSGYRLTLRPEFASLRNRFFGKVRESRLSQAAVDVLAIVAYQQPITADEINKLRGKPSGHVLNQLVHRQLLRIERSGPRRVARYHTTDRFLELFGLESLDDLPRD